MSASREYRPYFNVRSGAFTGSIAHAGKHNWFSFDDLPRYRITTKGYYNPESGFFCDSQLYEALVSEHRKNIVGFFFYLTMLIFSAGITMGMLSLDQFITFIDASTFYSGGLRVLIGSLFCIILAVIYLCMPVTDVDRAFKRVNRKQSRKRVAFIQR